MIYSNCIKNNLYTNPLIEECGINPSGGNESAIAPLLFSEKIHPQKYQETLIQDLLSAFVHSRRLALQLPTGGGKTVIFRLLALEFLKQGQKILILAHRKELIDQAHEKIEAISGLPASLFSFGDWRYCAKRLGYKQGWAYFKYQKAQSQTSPRKPKKTDLLDEINQKTALSQQMGGGANG
jgi:superfamily II DNA or RNA helicase